MEDPRNAQGGIFNIEKQFSPSSTGATYVCRMSGTFTPPIPKEIVLVLPDLYTGHYEEANIPTHIEEVWGPVPIAQHLSVNNCQVASHRYGIQWATSSSTKVRTIVILVPAEQGR